MKPWTTNALMGIVAAALLATPIGYARLAASRTAAMNSRQDLAAVKADLAELGAWHMTATPATDSTDLNRRIRSAATAAGLEEKLASIEPGPTLRVGDTDTLRTPIYLRLENVTLARLVPFLTDLARGDTSLRVTGIELSAPIGLPANGEETWTADLTLSESSIGGPVK